jgi:hypothetical protein
LEPENPGLEGMQVVSGFVERIFSQIEICMTDAQFRVQHRHRSFDAVERPPQHIHLTLFIPSLVFTSDSSQHLVFNGNFLVDCDFSLA